MNDNIKTIITVNGTQQSINIVKYLDSVPGDDTEIIMMWQTTALEELVAKPLAEFIQLTS